MRRGVLVRHLVLPNMTEDTKRVLDWLAAFDKTLPVSLIGAVFPRKEGRQIPVSYRRLYSHEYRNAVEYFFNVGLTQGYTQEAQSATKDYVPDFSDAEMAALLDKIPESFSGRYKKLHTYAKNRYKHERKKHKKGVTR